MKFKPNFIHVLMGSITACLVILILSLASTANFRVLELQSNTTFQIREYNAIIVKSCAENVNNGSCLGWTYEDNVIYIVGNRTIKQMINTCNHEVCHNLLNESVHLEEQLCQNIESTLNHPACQQLQTILTNQNWEFLK